MNKQQIQRLEEKIRVCVPESMEHSYNSEGCNICNRCCETEPRTKKCDIARPLSLQDLLIALDNVENVKTIFGGSRICVSKIEGEDGCDFDLRKDLHQNLQDNPDLVSFLSDLLL